MTPLKIRNSTLKLYVSNGILLVTIHIYLKFLKNANRLLCPFCLVQLLLQPHPLLVCVLLLCL